MRKLIFFAAATRQSAQVFGSKRAYRSLPIAERQTIEQSYHRSDENMVAQLARLYLECLAELQLDRELGEQIIQTAGLLSGRMIRMCRICTVDSTPLSTLGEAIFVFRVGQREETQDVYVDAVCAEIQRIADSLLSSGQVLAEAVRSWQNGSRKWENK